MLEIPLFIVDGFLDSGKSTFILDAIEKDGFSKKGRTLVILCEQGEVEITKEFANKNNSSLVIVEDQEELTVEFLNELANKYVPDRVILELNCLWDVNELYFPDCYRLAQVLTFIDANTFEVYYNNMRQKFKEMIEFSDLVVFNRCEDFSKILPYQTGLKLMNGNAQFMIMDQDGITKKAFEEPLPYDLTQEVIEIENDDFGVWYIDTFENPERYRGKTVSFIGYVTFSKKLPKGTFVVGRHAMNCCADDIQYYGHLCINNDAFKVKNKSWIKITARIEFEYSEEYQEEEAVLYPISIKAVTPLKNPILDLR